MDVNRHSSHLRGDHLEQPAAAASQPTTHPQKRPPPRQSDCKRALPLRDPTLLKTQALIAGTWRDCAARFSVRDPASGALLADLPDLGPAQTRAAIEAALPAQREWAARPAAERAAVLQRWRDLLIEHREDLARIITGEQGKPQTQANAEVERAADYLQWFAEEAKRVYGETIPAPHSDQRITVLRQALGVTAAITPWNFPLGMPARKLAPALAVGCAVVLKPSELATLSALALAELGLRAGLPPAVLSVVTSAQAAVVGAELCAHPEVRGLSFTGSTDVGKRLLAQCADTVKKVSLELGGNAPFIVFADADLDAAVSGLIDAKFRNAGQVCIAPNRVLVQREVYEEFTTRLVTALSRQSAEGSLQLGPLINDAALAKVQIHVADALSHGGRVLTGGEQPACGGTYFKPTVLSGLSPAMRIWREETFGPVAALACFHDEAEALALANDTPCGLAAYLYSRDLGRVTRMGERLEFGMVGINSSRISSEAAPFGGIKQSGIGREGARQGLDPYLETKHLMLGGVE